MSTGSEGARPARPRSAWPLALVLLLCGCAADAPVQDARDDGADTASGPTIYGQLGVSVDHVSTR